MSKIADWHMDILSKAIKGKYDITQFCPVMVVDLPRLRQNNVALSGWSLWWDPSSRQTPVNYIEQQIELALNLEKKGLIKIIKTSNDLNEVDEKLCVLLHLEGCLCLEEKGFEHFFDLGVRSLSLTWNEKNKFATGTGIKNDQTQGITDVGYELINQCRQNHVLIDISHLSSGGVRDLLKFDDQVVIATHANSRHVCDHQRNIDDDVVLEIARRDGAIGITLVPSFIDQTESTKQCLEGHFAHFSQLGAEHCISSGSDFEGTQLPPFINTLEKWCIFYLEMSKTYGEELLFNNMKRVLKDNLP